MADYSREQLVAALRKADAAGDTAAARAIAKRIQGMGQAVVQPQRTPEEQRALEDKLTGTSIDPTAGQSFGTNFHQGLGKFFADTGRGLGQLVGAVDQQTVDEARLRDAPLNNTWGGLLGQGAGAAATTFAAAPVSGGAMLANVAGRAAPYVGAAASGGLLAGAQPVATGESRAGNAATGAALGVLGQGIASGAQVAGKKAVESLSPVVRQSIEAARAAGIPLNVAQVTNSAPVRVAQAVTKYLPFSGASKSAKAQQEAFNRAVARSFGEDAPSLSDEVMRGARRRLGDQFDDIYGRNEVAITPDVARRMAQVESNAARDLTGDEAGRVSRQFQRILDDAGEGVMSGDKYKSLRGAIKKLEDNTQTGQYVRELRQLLDDAAVQSVGPDDAARLAKIRGQYANLRVAEDALKQVSGAAGDIRPASLYPLIRKGSTKEMRELAKIGQNVLKEGIGDSGSAQRQMYQSLLTGGAGLAAAGAGLGKLVLGGAVAGKALNSNAASKLLQQGRPTQGLARLLQPAPKLLPAAGVALSADTPFDIGTVSGYDRNDPRYRGD